MTEYSYALLSDTSALRYIHRESRFCHFQIWAAERRSGLQNQHRTNAPCILPNFRFCLRQKGIRSRKVGVRIMALCLRTPASYE